MCVVYSDRVQSLCYLQLTRQLVSCSSDGGIAVWNMDVSREEVREGAGRGWCGEVPEDLASGLPTLRALNADQVTDSPSPSPLYLLIIIWQGPACQFVPCPLPTSEFPQWQALPTDWGCGLLSVCRRALRTRPRPFPVLPEVHGVQPQEALWRPHGIPVPRCSGMLAVTSAWDLARSLMFSWERISLTSALFSSEHMLTYCSF